MCPILPPSGVRSNVRPSGEGGGAAREGAALLQGLVARLEGQRLALAQAAFEADRARRQFDGCEPSTASVARTVERALEETLAATTNDRDRKELLRPLVREVVLTVHAPRPRPRWRSSGRAPRAPS